jgi:hypothetical protein
MVLMSRSGEVSAVIELPPFTKEQRRRIQRIRDWERNSEEELGLGRRQDDGM